MPKTTLDFGRQNFNAPKYFFNSFKSGKNYAMTTTNKSTKKAAKPAKKGKTAKKAATAPRNNYSDELKDEARDLYQRGVSLDRIAKYVGVPLRTLTNWQTAMDWTESKKPNETAPDLKRRGFKVPEIAARLGLSVRTVYKHLNAEPIIGQPATPVAAKKPPEKPAAKPKKRGR